MKDTQIKSVVIDIIARQFSVDDSYISDCTNILDDLEADSLDVVELLMEIEDELGIAVPDADVLGLRTINEVVSYISRHASESNPVVNITST